MSQPFSIYLNSFDGSTLLYARADSGWLQGKSVIGPDLTNVGATPQDDGYRFVAAEQDRMTASLPAQDARSALTLEAWVGDVKMAAGENYTLVSFVGPNTAGGANGMFWVLRRHATTPASSSIRAGITIDGTLLNATWAGTVVDTLLTSCPLLYVAGVRDGTTARVFVKTPTDGAAILRHSQTVAATDWPAGTWTLNVGMRAVGIWHLSGVLDEVRLSSVARYAADFPIARFQDGRRAVVRGPEMRAGLTAGVIQ